MQIKHGFYVRDLGYKNLYVMKGGLNEWFAKILNPTEPPQTAPTEEYNLYIVSIGCKAVFSWRYCH